MNAIFVLLPLALLIAGIAVALFIWAVRSGQFDDLDTPPVRILFDDETPTGDRRRDPESTAAAPGRSQTR
ncbi:MAG: cbb3-type cytochrome oxidase assembly protein CcoS [Candidatus Latescibacterota bacterium]|jgi:cbb3-type cytochrome oxidase maturation protein